MTSKLVIRVFAFALVAASALTACGGTSTSSAGGPAKIGVVLTYNLPGFWGNYLKYESRPAAIRTGLAKLIGTERA